MDDYYGQQSSQGEYQPGNYGGYPQGGQVEQADCLHKYVTGADGAVYCEKCGSVLKDNYAFQSYRPSRPAVPAKKAFSGRTLVALIAIAIVIVAGVVAWSLMGKRPAPVASVDKPEVINLSNEPIQDLISQNEVIYKREDGMSYNPLASYKIWAKVLGVRSYAGYGKGSSGFPIDLALTWGDVAKSDYEKYVSFHFSSDYSANQWLMFQYKTDSPPWSTGYFDAHVSNTHVCPATENLYNAIMSLKHNDEVILEGYLARSVSPTGQFVLGSSLSRTDTEAGACEAFYVQKVQVGDKVYK